ncbi:MULTISPECIES: HNH endonuclease [unclassified Acinetobacter]|uniref:HNH endonuclease n=1 Tax=unclassified Acinetobacter TaxID=196816 RepID=UPI0012503747|nr:MULTISPECIES: HNH endonuclease [unclassified Acinetobacter]
MRLPKLSGSSLPTLKSNQPTLPAPEKNYGKGRGGRPWRRLKHMAHVRDEWTCCSCGRVTMDLECDHIVNKAQGGTDDLSNLQSLCYNCHEKKNRAESKAGM